MHMSLIIKKVIEYIYGRKFNFILTIVVMVITFYMIFLVSELSFKSNYYIYETKNNFNTENFVNVNVIMDTYKNDYYDDVKIFIDKLKQKYGDNFGSFMYLTVNYNVNGESKSQDTLYIDESALDLCKLSLEEDISSEEYIKGYVCKERLDEYPIGTVLENANTMSKIIIVGYFDSGSSWVPSLLFHTQDASITLDNYIVSIMDKSYFDVSTMFYGNLFNSIYVKVDNAKELDNMKRDIKVIADELGIKCYTYTLNDLIEIEKEENQELLKTVGILVMFVVIVAMTGILSACLADVLSRHYEIAVMSLNGVAPIDLYMMLLFENIIKIIIAFCMATFLYGRGVLGVDKLIFVKMVIPIVLIGSILFIIMVTSLSFLTIRQKKLLTLVEGVRL